MKSKLTQDQDITNHKKEAASEACLVFVFNSIWLIALMIVFFPANYGQEDGIMGSSVCYANTVAIPAPYSCLLGFLWESWLIAAVFYLRYAGADWVKGLGYSLMLFGMMALGSRWDHNYAWLRPQIPKGVILGTMIISFLLFVFHYSSRRTR